VFAPDAERGLSPEHPAPARRPPGRQRDVCGGVAARGYRVAGLYPTVVGGTRSCARTVTCPRRCRARATGECRPDGVLHGLHANVYDPPTDDARIERQPFGCYRCHPGSETKCLRGVMGNAVAADGTMVIQCQDCHGPMSPSAPDSYRLADEPTCQNCHTGTATANSGQIRYTSALLANGQPRAASDQTFATQPDVPAAGFSLYRFSAGHGGLQCAACHGSTHAEYPSSHQNDNVQSIALQGHVGTVAECITWPRHVAR